MGAESPETLATNRARGRLAGPPGFSALLTARSLKAISCFSTATPCAATTMSNVETKVSISRGNVVLYGLDFRRPGAGLWCSECPRAALLHSSRSKFVMMIFTESHSHSLMIKRNAELTYICYKGPGH